MLNRDLRVSGFKNSLENNNKNHGILRLPAAARSLKNTTHFVDILGGVIGKGVAIRLTSIMAASVKVS